MENTDKFVYYVTIQNPYAHQSSLVPTVLKSEISRNILAKRVFWKVKQY